jgi:hypothetical protein
MDPRHRADELLSRARSRGAFVVTPDNATSPMDAASTVRISREVVAGLGGEDRNSTVMLRRPEPQQQGAPHQQGSQQHGQQQNQPQQHGQQQGHQQQVQPAPPHQPGPQSGQQGPAPQGPPQQSGPAPAQSQTNQGQTNQGQSNQPQSAPAQSAPAQSAPARSAPAQPQRDTGPVDTTAWPTEDPQKPMTQFHFPQEFPR